MSLPANRFPHMTTSFLTRCCCMVSESIIASRGAALDALCSTSPSRDATPPPCHLRCSLCIPSSGFICSGFVPAIRKHGRGERDCIFDGSQCVLVSRSTPPVFFSSINPVALFSGVRSCLFSSDRMRVSQISSTWLVLMALPELLCPSSRLELLPSCSRSRLELQRRCVLCSLIDSLLMLSKLPVCFDSRKHLGARRCSRQWHAVLRPQLGA